MRILHVITSLHIGGAEKLMTIMLPRLRNLGNDVDLLVFDGSHTAFTDALSRAGIRILSLNARRVYSPANILKLRKFLRGYDIVHTHNTACQLFVPLALKLVSGRKPILVTTEHNTTNRRRDMRWFRPVDKWMYSRYARIICIGESTRRNLCNYLGRELPADVIHNGIELPGASEPAAPDLAAEIIITMVAAFRPQKDQDCALRAMTLLPDNYLLRLVGDGELRAEVEHLAAELKLGERVRFLGNRSDVNALLAQSHINLLASHWEGLSLSSLESMAACRPFVASDVQGLREIVGGYGVLFPDSDAESLAKEIKALTENPQRYESVAAQCRRRAEQFDIAITANNYNSLYLSLHGTNTSDFHNC